MLQLFIVFKVSSLIKKGFSSTCRVIFKILLNEEKTEFFLTGTKQQLAKVDIGHIKVGKVNIAPHSPVKNLGVWFDSNLSMVDHITKTYSAAKEYKETLIHAFIFSRLDYCTASYLEFLTAIFTNYSESRMQLHTSYFRRADFVISYLCSSHYTGCL